MKHTRHSCRRPVDFFFCSGYADHAQSMGASEAHGWKMSVMCKSSEHKAFLGVLMSEMPHRYDKVLAAVARGPALTRM